MAAPAFVMAVWCMIAPRPYTLCVLVCALTPWVALTLPFFFGGRLVFDGRNSEKRPDVFYLVFLPALAIGARALMDFHILDWKMALAAAIGVSIVWNIAILAARRGERAKTFAFMTITLLLFGVDYGYGLVTFADVLGDRALVASYTPQITSKHVTHGKSADYYLDLTAWGGRGQDEESVPRAFYNTFRPGDRICIKVHPGHLGMKWFEVTAYGACPAQG